MNLPCRRLLLTVVFAAPLASHAGTSMLRVACEGDDAGAEVSVNGKLKGVCPLDIQVDPGTLKLRAVKYGGSLYEQVFEQTIQMGNGVSMAVEARLGATQLNAVDQQQDAARRNTKAGTEQRGQGKR
ncbi:MAG: hypothetical protein EPN14_03540 [Gallionella sp.]|nr:MAG: hypothetical protein EPN14_03540 [Gallionella sp.]